MGVWAALGGFVCLALVGCSSDDGGAECVNNGSDAIRVCAKGKTLPGIDVSSYQGTINWTKVKASGQVYAFVRVADSTTKIDNTFPANWAGAKNAGILRGAYQYFRPSLDAKAQADLFIEKINAAGGLKTGDLPPVLDFETTSDQPNDVVVSKAKTWLDRVESKLGMKPIIYSGKNMEGATQAHFSSYILWVPNYGATCPNMPVGWSDWTFWQTSDTGSVSGINGNVDTNLFNGELPKLKSFTLNGPPAPPDSTSDPTSTTPSTEASHARPNDGSEGATMNDPNERAETILAPSIATCN